MTENLENIAIVGAGPAGSWLAGKLAQAGRAVTLFDCRAPWEKPCGGGLTPKVFVDFPELGGLGLEVREHYVIRVIFADDDEVELGLGFPLIIVSRLELNEALLNAAIMKGALFVKEKVKVIERRDGVNIIRAGDREYQSQLIVGADGVAGVVRKTFASPFPREDLCLTRGALIHQRTELPVIIKFFQDQRGYAWVFPRRDATSVGIAVEGNGKAANYMDPLLRNFVDKTWKKAGLGPPGPLTLYSRLLPHYRPENFIDPPLQGKGWALLGDASGSVDPITGEGLYYAFKTADMLADAINADGVEGYGAAWRDMARREIGWASSREPRFYKPRNQWLLKVGLAYSTAARRLAGDMMSGFQSYHTLKARVYAELPAYLSETAYNAVRGRRGRHEWEKKKRLPPAGPDGPFSS